MARVTWGNDTEVNAANLGNNVQKEDLQPQSSTFNSTTGRVLTHNYGHQNYQVLITPTADPGGNLGEVYVVKGDDTATVYNSGSATTAFDYLIVPWE